MEEERQYLQLVYNELQARADKLAAQLRQVHRSGRKTLQAMTGDISLNFDSLSDNLDTFSMIEMKNREIDQLNLVAAAAEREAVKVQQLLTTPYFGKVTVDFLDGEENNFYIGTYNFVNSAGNDRIYDWRSPIAELFYNNQLGPSSYQPHDVQLAVDIKNRRQFLIEKHVLLKYFDTATAIQDDVLLAVLAQNAAAEMKAITATIQQEQNQVIRDLTHDHLLVNGIAGSGKTSTIMQRIAYLLYRLRQQITADNVLILAPNDRFIHYLAGVLPTLGEKNPRSLTLLQFVAERIAIPLETQTAYFDRISQPVKAPAATELLRSAELTAYIHGEAEAHLQPEACFKAIVYRQKVLVSRATILQFYQETPSGASLRGRIQAVKSRLASYWESQLMRQAKSQQLQDQLLTLTEEQQERYFGELIDEEAAGGLAGYAEKRLRQKYRRVTKQIHELTWLDLKQLFEQVFHGFTKEDYHWHKRLTLDEAVILLLLKNQFIEALSDEGLQFLLIDEIQDYTLPQLSLLLLLFPKAKLTLVGDENQAIFDTSLAFAQIEELFARNRRPLQRYDLLTSYRSSGAITELFSKLVTTTEQLQIIPVRPTGAAPVFFATADAAAEILTIRTILAELPAGATLTILTKTRAEAVALTERLTAATITETQVLPIYLAKGLEFDRVLIFNVSQSRYQTRRDKQILYTAISRGMQQVFLTYREQLTDLLN